MNKLDAATYLSTVHARYFKKEVKGDTVKRWYRKGYLKGLDSHSLDNAVQSRSIPPKRGRPRKITPHQIADALDLVESGISQAKAAKEVGMSESMLSRVIRGERRSNHQ